MENKITRSIFYFSFISEFKKRKKITQHRNSSTVRRRKFGKL